MIDTIDIILILFNIVFGILGYLIGKGSQTKIESQPISFFTKEKLANNKINKIAIDETKVVTDINTANLEKKFDNLGELKVSNENIESSINKLKNIKR